ncbi:DUF6531 domain-containing protein [Actinoallomurus soli]|uniref:DUF6531 domain-containing protein n=1 Tax=Actinoallomurus soli TaxID=2952535 RepID=UPI0020924056|nr:DUF6531 domain-containing protein [Actinoallomurus soli]MCO5967033.1 DUF6531 domain-containing protein [Actinoallomurus soli]
MPGAVGEALSRTRLFGAVGHFLRLPATGTAVRRAAGDAGHVAERAQGSRLASLRATSRRLWSRVTTKDPIDVATGEVVLRQTDVELAGVLPLVLERTHVSSYRSGSLLGPSWASTLDQRLAADASGMTFAAEDGMLLVYPPPSAGTTVWPLEGPRWPLAPVPGGGYTVTDPQAGVTRHFAAADPARPGNLPLTAVTDRNGNRITLVYDETATLTEVRHSAGYRIAVDVVDGRLRMLRLLTGESGDDAVDLVRYGYDQAGHLAEVIDSSGRPLRFSYDDTGRMTEWLDRNGSWYRYTYDEQGRGVRGEGSGGFLNTRVEYAPDGRRTRVTDSLGNVTTYHFNDLGQVIAEADPHGHRTVSEWDRYDRLLARADPLGHTTRYSYDEAGNVTAILRPDGHRIISRYNELNLPVALVEADGETTWRQEYDERGNLIAVTDPLGHTTRRAYDHRGRLTTITDAVGGTTRVVPNPAGLPMEITDPSGARLRVERDAFGRVTAVTDPVGGVTRYGWTTEGRPAWRALPGGAVERWIHDGEGNAVAHVDPLGRTTRTAYTHFDLPAARTGPDGARLEFGYDTEARLISVTNAQGLVWRYDYDAAGRLVGETDFNGRRLTYAYDAAGRLISRLDQTGEAVRFTRDPLGRMTARTGDGGVVTLAYDAAGRLIRAAGPDTEVVFGRDRLGRIVAETRDGATVTSTYDARGRRIHRRTPSGAESHWAYDSAGRPIGLRTGGLTLGFAHDPAGREIERRIGDGVLLAQQWDPDHRLTAQTLWAAPGVGPAAATPEPGTPPAPSLLQHRAYAYRADGYLTGIADQRDGVRALDVDPAGRVTAVRAAGWTERYAYDTAGNVTHALWPATSASGSPDDEAFGDREYSGTLLRRAGRVHYEHDVHGRVVARRHRTLSGKVRTWRFTWNGDDRLTSVITPEGREWQYRYDPLGRRVEKRLVGRDGVIERTDFTWDGPVLAEQTRTVRRPGGSARRTITWEHRPGTFEPLTQTERSPDHEARRGRVDERFHAIITDLVGRPAELVDASGRVMPQPATNLWGAGLGNDARPCPLGFPGQYHDPETGLEYNHWRYYDPVGGRYQSGDPLGITPQPDPHAYVHNPTAAADPLGLAPYLLENNRSMWEQNMEMKAARDRGLTPVTLREDAGMESLIAALRGETEFKWAVVPGEGGAHELRVMPFNYGAGGWNRVEMAHTILAGPGGRVYAAGSGSVLMEGFPASINRASGHFEPGPETMGIGSAAFERAGIDVIVSNTY